MNDHHPSQDCQPSAAIAQCSVLGVNVSAINYDIAIDTVFRWIEQKQRKYVTVTGVHGVMESQRDDELKRIHNRAGLVTPDGMPMVWLSRAAGKRDVSRVYGPELMLRLCEASQDHGYRHFLYGGADGVADQLARNLKERFPNIQIAGTYCPPFRALTEEEDNDVVNQINDSGADLVWVGLSTPKQERWMAAHVGRLNAAAMLGVGAAFDFHTGRVKQAPSWMQRSGLEWLFRLIQEPRRLWKRYLTNNPQFIACLALSRLGLKNFELTPETSPSG